MKLFVLAVLSVFTVQNSFASQSSQVLLSAQEPSKLLQMTDQRFEPIYAEEPYQDTCSRQVVDHTETRCETYDDQVCSGGGEVCTTTNDSVCNSQGCTSVPRRSCHSEPQSCTTVPRRSCSNYNVYRTEYYSCTKYRTVVVGQRLVKTFNHQIEVLLEQPAAIGAASLQVLVNVDQNSISARLVNSFTQNVLTYQVAKVSEADAGSVLNSSKKLVISLGASADVLKAIASSSIQNLELGHNAVRFDLQGASVLAQHLKIEMKLVRNRAIFGDKTLYDSDLSSSTLGLVGAGSDLKVVLPFEKLGIKSINSLRYDLAVNVGLDIGNALNAADFSSLLKKRLQVSLTKIRPSF